jgi:hypothetical protein
MVERTWHHLLAARTVTQQFMLSTEGLNVKRSAFVAALVSRFDGVRVVSTRPTELEYRPHST